MPAVNNKPQTKISLAVSRRLRLYLEDPEVMISREIRHSAIIVLVVIIINILVMFFLVTKIKQEAAALGQKESLIYLTTQRNQLNADLEKNWPEISPIVPKIKNALPDPTDLLNYQASLEQAAEQVGVEISVAFSAPTNNNPSNLPDSSSKSQQSYAGVGHQVKITGSLAGISQFLANLEKLPYYVQINNFNLKSEENIQKQATAELSLKIYTSPDTVTSAAKGQS